MSVTILNLFLPLVVVACTLAWGPLPAGILGVVGALGLHAWLQSRIASSLGPRAAEGPDAEAELVSWVDPARSVREHVRSLRGSEEDARFERVRTNLRAMALTELWHAVGRDDADTPLGEAVTAFCRRELGNVDVAVLRLDPRAAELFGSWCRERDGVDRGASVRWGLAALEGTVARALRSARSVVELEDHTEVPLRVGGERPRVAADLGPHLVVPLMAPAPRVECSPEAWLYREGCPAHRPHPDAVARGRATPPARAMELGSCGACAHFPIHGVLLVGERSGGQTLRRSHLPVVESIAAATGTVLEHAALVREIRGAQRFRDQVLDAIMNGLVSTDQHGRIVYANARAREILGTGDLLGRRLDDCVALPGGSNALTHTLIEGRAFLQADAAALVVEATGAVRRLPIRINLTPFRPEDGGVSGAVCILEDRSTLRAMEQEIRHLDTLAAIGRFASSLAHEVRNPLGGIQAGMEYIGRGLERVGMLDTDTRENLDVVRGEIERIDGILRNLLSVARPREMVLTECDPGSLVQRGVRSFARLAETRDVELQVQVASGLDPVHADADMIHQVLTNLLKNALEAAPRGSRVEVRALAHRDPTGEEPSDGVVIEVLDRGSGIAEEDLPRLFEPFFSRKSNGTGLGLYVCHGFVQRHDGRLWAENREGGGARFVLELPRVPALMGVSR